MRPKHIQPPSPEQTADAAEGAEADEETRPDKKRDRSRGQFCIFSHEWLKKFGPKLSRSERCVYDALAMRFSPDQDGLVWMKLSTIAAIVGTGRRKTAAEAIKKLQGLGLIDVIDFGVYVDKLGRVVGGGKEEGTHNVFALLHVDELGHHRAERVRPTMEELAAAEDETLALNDELHRMLYAGRPYKVIRDLILSRYPCMADSIIWTDEDPAPDIEGQAMSVNGLMITPHWAVMGELEKRFPDCGRPNVLLAARRPGRPSLEDTGRKVCGPVDEHREAVRADYKAVLQEAERLGKEEWRGIQVEEVGRFQHAAPVTVRLCRQIGIIPPFVYLAAKDVAMERGEVFYDVEGGKLAAIECKPPERWVDPEVWDLATVNKYHDEECDPPRSQITEAAVRQAQAQVREAFIRGVLSDPWTEPVDQGQLARLICEKFNHTVQVYNRDAIYPAPTITPADVKRVSEEMGVGAKAPTPPAQKRLPGRRKTAHPVGALAPTG